MFGWQFEFTQILGWVYGRRLWNSKVILESRKKFWRQWWGITKNPDWPRRWFWWRNQRGSFCLWGIVMWWRIYNYAYCFSFDSYYILKLLFTCRKIIIWILLLFMSFVSESVKVKAMRLIKEGEGLRLEKYLDTKGLPTIGYGHLILKN